MRTFLFRDEIGIAFEWWGTKTLNLYRIGAFVHPILNRAIYGIDGLVFQTHVFQEKPTFDEVKDFVASYGA